MYNLLTVNRQRKYSVERLRYLYAELLRCIDVASEDLSPREVEHYQHRRRRFGKLRKIPFLQKDEVMDDDDERKLERCKDLAAAFWALAATKAANYPSYGEACLREATPAAKELARALEETVIRLIRNIGEVVVNSGKDAPKSVLRSDATFEYFCERRILHLLVDIVEDKPNKTSKTNSWFHGVVWSPSVKAQVFQTVSLLVSSMRDPSALYYIFSQQSINQLISSVFPLNQWTHPALEIMLLPFIDLLKNLSLQLAANANLLPFFILDSSDHPVFPLFSAILDTGTSDYAQADSYIHATCLNLIVSLMNVPHPPLQKWLCDASAEQNILATHLCGNLLHRFHRLTDVTTGPVVDAVRSDAIAGQMIGLNGHLNILNDVFECDIGIFNVRLCEALLQRVISVLLKSLIPSRKFLAVGMLDSDVVPDCEAKAQVATHVLSRFFCVLDYSPFLRMLAVALFHEKTSKVWESEMEKNQFKFTKALNDLVQGNDKDCVANIYLDQILKSVQGSYGEWRQVTACLLCQSVILSKCLDFDLLASLNVFNADGGEKPLPMALSLTQALTREFSPVSGAGITIVEVLASLAVHYILQNASCVVQRQKDQKIADVCRTSAVRKALETFKKYFFKRALEMQIKLGAADIYVDLVEEVIQSRYKYVRLQDSRPYVFACFLSQYDGTRHCASSELLVRKLRSTNMNEVEEARFFLTLAFHLRSMCRVLVTVENRTTTSQDVSTGFASSRSPNRLSVKPLTPNGHLQQHVEEKLTWVDVADTSLTRSFSSLKVRSPVGSDLNPRGRKIFNCVLSEGGTELASEKELPGLPRPSNLEDQSQVQHALVVDPWELYVVKAITKSRSEIICVIPLTDMIAAAADGPWLHVAVRHNNVPGLIRNGNLAVWLDGQGTSLLVQRYLEQCQRSVRQEILKNIHKLFSDAPPIPELATS